MLHSFQAWRRGGILKWWRKRESGRRTTSFTEARDGPPGGCNHPDENPGNLPHGVTYPFCPETRLEHILRELDREPERSKKYRPVLGGHHDLFARIQHQSLRELLLEVEKEAMNDPACASPKSILSTVISIPVDFYRIPFDLYLHSAPFPHYSSTERCSFASTRRLSFCRL